MTNVKQHLLFTLLCFAPLTARAQNTNLAYAESASVARAAWGRAAAAMRAKDLPTARREISRAAEAWPTQPYYVMWDARSAALTGDTAALLRSLRLYAGMQLGTDLRADSAFAKYLALQEVTELAQQLDANDRALARSREVAHVSDSTFWPEGMDYDARTRRFYVASIGHGTIAELSSGTRERLLTLRFADGRKVGSLLGVRVDTARGVLWATLSSQHVLTGYPGKDTSTWTLARVRIADGAVEEYWDLPVVERGHVLGDLAVGPKGDVFVTDSRDPVLYRLRPGGKALERITSPLFNSLQGAAATPDGRYLYVADYSHGLLRVDLLDGDVLRLSDAPGSTSLGCDGIVLYRGAIVAVQNGVAPARVMRFVLDGSGTRIVKAEVLDRNSGVADEPTIGAMVGSEFVYVANSAWEKYAGPGIVRAGAKLTRPVLLGVQAR